MLDIQTEHLENHIARLTVKVEPDRIEQAMRVAARRIAKKSRIKGFRPGKAPYNVVLSLYGREYVLGEALDTLGQDIYREALEASDVEPYAPGALEDINEDDGVTLTFTLPKRPEIDLGNYRDELRLEYEVEEVTDEMLERAVEDLRQNQAVVEDADRAAALGDQVVLAHIQVEAEVLDSDEEDEAEEAEEEAAADEAETEQEEAGDEAEEAEEEAGPATEVLIHEHNFTRVLTEDVERDLFPGFSAHLVGLSAGDEAEFTLELADDFENEDLAGRTLHIEAHVEKVQSRTVPEWSDDLAARIAEKLTDSEIATILELRAEVRKQLQERAENLATNELTEEALTQLVEMATFKYPKEVVDDYLKDLLEEMDRNLQQQGIKLDDYLRIMGQSREELGEQYREAATARAERALALGQLVTDEQLSVSEEDINGEVDRIIGQMGAGEQADQFRQFFTSPMSLANIETQMVNERVLRRLAAIAKGENPPVGPDAKAEVETAETDETEAQAEVEAEPVADEAEVAAESNVAVPESDEETE